MSNLNPRDPPASQSEASKQPLNPRRLASEIIGVCLATSVLVSVVTIIIWEQTYVIPDVPNMSQWRPIDDLATTTLFIPLGFLIYCAHPAGWLFWLGLCATWFTRSRLPFAVSIAASAWFGYLWPTHFQSMLGI